MNGFTKTDSGYIYVFGNETEMINKRVEFTSYAFTNCELLRFLTIYLKTARCSTP